MAVSLNTGALGNGTAIATIPTCSSPAIANGLLPSAGAAVTEASELAEPASDAESSSAPPVRASDIAITVPQLSAEKQPESIIRSSSSERKQSGKAACTDSRRRSL